ncbi:MAG: hypothetical protein Q9186_005528 [Xanthomendoza sp. 1 TL-2023]
MPPRPNPSNPNSKRPPSTSQPSQIDISSLVPTRFGILLFPAFQALDAFGPLDALNALSWTHPMTLAILTPVLNSLAPISTLTSIPTSPGFTQSVVPTHTLEDAPELDVLLIPGGMGLFNGGGGEEMQRMTEFIRKIYPSLHSIISVCNGASLLARSGILAGKSATTNKAFFQDVVASGAEVGDGEEAINWVKKARWVDDGKIWTSSGVSAGIDVTLAWMGKVYGEEVAGWVAKGMEYTRHEDAGSDPFAEVHGVV